MFEIDVQTAEADVVYADLLRASVHAALMQQAASSPATVALLLTDDVELRSLNSQYRGIDKPTDVLSFEDGEPPFPGAPIHLGDLAISLPYAQRQAALGGHPVSAELQLLAVHGTLHLLGHDHASPDEKATMWQAQTAILQALNCPITSPANDP